jgi:hypothetical protein
MSPVGMDWSLGNQCELMVLNIKEVSQALVAHACNPSYLGGREQEICGSKPALGK